MITCSKSLPEQALSTLWPCQPITPPLPHRDSVRVRMGRFQGNRFELVTYDMNVLRSWDLSPETRPDNQLNVLAELFAARHIDHTGGFTFLTVEETKEKWLMIKAGD